MPDWPYHLQIVWARVIQGTNTALTDWVLGDLQLATKGACRFPIHDLVQTYLVNAPYRAMKKAGTHFPVRLNHGRYPGSIALRRFRFQLAKLSSKMRDD